jgi:hypothetical protein
VTRWSGIVLVVTGLVGFFGAFAGTICRYHIPRSLQLPLGDIQSIAVDRSGRIYCFSGGYMRVQQYSAGGRFLRGWPSPYKSAVIKTDRHGRVHLLDGDQETVYDHTGRKLEQRHLAESTDWYPGKRTLTWRTEPGWVYRAVTPNLWPRVTRTSPTGAANTAVGTPVLMWLLAGPLPGWLRFVAGIVILRALKRFSPPARESA